MTTRTISRVTACFAAAALLAGHAFPLSAKTPDRPTSPSGGELIVDDPPPVDSEANLMPNGGFEKPADDKTHPAHWQPIDNLVWHWTTDTDDPDRGKVIQMNTNVSQEQAYQWWIDRFVHGQPLDEAPEPESTSGGATVGGLEGGFYWSHYIPVEQGGAYRLYVDAKGPASFAFIRGYEKKPPISFGDEHPAVQQRFREPRGEPTHDEDGRPIHYRLRYLYTTKVPVGGSDEWKTYSHRQPRHPNSRVITENVRWVRVMLYPHWPPGEYGYDNIRLIEVDPVKEQADPDAEEADYEEGKVVR